MISGEKLTGEQIAQEFDLRSSSEVRESVNWLRRQGDPAISRIASDGDGYWWTSRWEDVEQTVHHMKGRAFSILDASRGLARAFGKAQVEQESLAL